MRTIKAKLFDSWKLFGLRSSGYSNRLSGVVGSLPPSMKDKLSFLTEEREAVRERLGAMKMDAKALNRASNSRSIDFAHAFIAAAERLLPDEMFLELESRAADILSSEQN